MSTVETPLVIKINDRLTFIRATFDMFFGTAFYCLDGTVSSNGLRFDISAEVFRDKVGIQEIDQDLDANAPSYIQRIINKEGVPVPEVRPLYSIQKLFCQGCGEPFGYRANAPYHGRACCFVCWKEIQWRETLSMMGRKYYEDPSKQTWKVSHLQRAKVPYVES
jgi:hypothetical protein